MAEKTSANIGFEKQIWDAACGGTFRQRNTGR